MLVPVAPLDVVDVLVPERAALLELLRSLSAADWARPTECPAYTVQGVATHILGDDLSLLSRQRDSAPPSLLRYFEQGVEFPHALHAFNDSWVDIAQFLSPALLMDQLAIVGEWTHAWYATVDPMARGEVVGYFGSVEPSQYWQISAREYAERWIHQQQLRRAVEAPDLDDPALYFPAADAVILSTISRLGDAGSPPGTSMAIEIAGIRSWTATRNAERWDLYLGSDAHAAVHIGIDPRLAPAVLSQGHTEPELRDSVVAREHSDVANHINALLARS